MKSFSPQSVAFTTKPFSGFAASCFSTEVRGIFQEIHFLGKGDK
jgi:hypothetical protein